MGEVYLNQKSGKNRKDPVQKKSETKVKASDCLVIQRTEDNRTGIPGQLKQSFEQRSGFSFDDVRVHYHSDKPASVGALAYTQGNQVYIGSGQERHLQHELVHVVQQKKGMVQPTRTFRRFQLNDDARLEQEADRGIF